MRFRQKVIAAFLALVLVAGVLLWRRQSMPAHAAGSAYDASDMLGQLDGGGDPDYTASLANNGDAKGFIQPMSEAVDGVHHRLFVVDNGNNRVLEFNLDGSNNLVDRIADHVLGQTNFRSDGANVTQNTFFLPEGIAYDGTNNRLFVSDVGNNRVMVFDVASITDGENAVNVIGQTNFTDHGTSMLTGPIALAYDSNNSRLFVSDIGNQRVVVFDVDPVTLVPNDSGTDGPSQINVIDSIALPYGLAYDVNHDRLFVSAGFVSAIYVYDADPAVLVANDSGTDDPPPINTIGHPNSPGTTINDLSFPSGLSYDAAHDRLFVADDGNNRVTVYDADPAVLVSGDSGTDGPDAVNVIGQSNYSSVTVAATQNGVSLAYGTFQSIDYDSASDHLFVADGSNNRVTVYDVDPAVLVSGDSGSDGPDAIDAIGHIDGSGDPIYTRDGYNNGPDALGLVNPEDPAVDTVHHRLFVVDTGNNRVLEYDLDSDNNLIDHAADHVIGQSDFIHGHDSISQSTLAFPSAIAYDGVHDRLFVADGNNRILVFDTSSITDGENAINVIGAPDFTTFADGTTDQLFENPFGVAYDPSHDRLFVADSLNNRVMVFDVDPGVLVANDSGTDEPHAINVIGQIDFSGAGAATTQTGLNDPIALTYDVNYDRLFVADDANNRVTVYDVDPAGTHDGTGLHNIDGESAINVIGQPDYTHTDQVVTQSGMAVPIGLVYDSMLDRLFVSDIGNNRVLTYDADPTVLVANDPGSDGPDAVAVLGQPDFVTGAATVARDGLDVVFGLGYDPSNGRLFAANSGNNSVMIFDLIQITTLSLPGATVGEAYAQPLDTVHTQGTVSFSLMSGTLPPGLTLGSVDGTPTTSGDYTFTVRATDDLDGIGSFFDDQTYSMTIGGGTAPTPVPGGGGGGIPYYPPTSTPGPATPSPTPSTLPNLSSLGLHEGDVIGTASPNDPDIYIINDWGYKRLFLNPIIFSFYGHLGGFSAVKHISVSTRDLFSTSGLFRNCETQDQKVYAVQVTGEDTGILHWLNISGDQAVSQDPDFFHKVFCINSNEFNWYTRGSDYTSEGQVPLYTR